jgi:hypothetical protein
MHNTLSDSNRAFTTCAVSSLGKAKSFAALPGNRFENLKGDRKGQCSIRINDKWRICFEWLNLQSLYDLRLAQQKPGKAIDRLPTLKKLEHSPG